MRSWLMAIVVFLGAIAAGRLARACSCGSPSLERTLVPPSGTADFPTNGHIRILLHGFPEALRTKLVEEYRLKDDRGTLVPILGQVNGIMLSLVPRAPLRPKTRYTVERAHAFSADGRRLSDHERWGAAEDHDSDARIGEPALRRWYQDGWLVTGDGVERRRPPAPPPIKVKIDFRYGGGDCGPGTSIEASFDLGALTFAPSDILMLERKGHGILGRYVPQEIRESPGRGVAYASDMMCVADVADIDPKGNFYLRLVVLSAADVRVPSAKWAAADPQKRRPRSGPYEDEAWMRSWTNAAVARWFAAPISESDAGERIAGPKACPFGLESQGRSELGGPVPGMVGDGISLGWNAGEARIIGNDQHARSGWIISGSKGTPGPRLALPDPVDAVRASFRPDAALVAIVSYGRDGDSRINTIMMSSDGRIEWTRALGEPGTNRHPVLAWGPRRALVCWSRYEAPLCTVLDTTDGRVVRPAAPLPTAPGDDAETEASDDDVAAVAIEGGFAVAWTAKQRPQDTGPIRREARLTLLTDAGAPIATRRLRGEAVRSLDLQRVGTRLAVAWDSPRGIEVSWLGMEGQPQGAPYVLAGGSSLRLPRLAQRQGLLAVGWTDAVGPHAFVATTDPSGAVSPRLEVGIGLGASMPALAPTDDGFAVAYSVGYGERTYLETLVRRGHAPDGPPDRIAMPSSKP